MIVLLVMLQLLNYFVLGLFELFFERFKNCSEHHGVINESSLRKSIKPLVVEHLHECSESELACALAVHKLADAFALFSGNEEFAI